MKAHLTTQKVSSSSVHVPTPHIERAGPLKSPPADNLNGLSSEERVEISEIVAEFNAEATQAGPATKQKIDPLFFEYSANRLVKTRNELIKRNTPLVSYIVTKFYANDRSFLFLKEDLMQEGLIGLMSAIEGFKPELGFRFSTYATWWIRQSVNSFLLNVEPMIHVPSHVRIAKGKLAKKLTAENRTLGGVLADYKSSEFSEKMMQSITRAGQTKNIVSFDEPSKHGEPTLAETIPDERELNTEMLFSGAAVSDLVKNALDKLSERERLVLLLRFDIIQSV